MTPQEALVAIARERDIDALIVQPEMLRGHLMDYCRGGNRREFNLLVTACHSRVPQGLRAPSSSVLQVDRIADLARRMVDDHDTSLEGARWAVGTWALALGLLWPWALALVWPWALVRPWALARLWLWALALALGVEAAVYPVMMELVPGLQSPP